MWVIAGTVQFRDVVWKLRLREYVTFLATDCSTQQVQFSFLFLFYFVICPSPLFPSVTCVGFIVDKETTFSNHGSLLTARYFYWLRQLHTIRRTLANDFTVDLVNTRIIRCIDYCNSVLASVFDVHLWWLQCPQCISKRATEIRSHLRHDTTTLASHSWKASLQTLDNCSTVSVVIHMYLEPQHHLMDPAVSLFLDLSARTFYLHRFTVHPCYLNNSTVNYRHFCFLRPMAPCYHECLGCEICKLQIP